MPCDNPQNQKFCAQSCNYSPACVRGNKDNNYPALFSWMGLEEGGILVKLFELKDILLQNKKVDFSAKGFCMYPVIRPTDKLHIELKTAEQIKVGEVAVYRRNNRLFAHRTIDKGNSNGAPYIITRPDNAKSGNDGPSFDENIVGVVSAIERKRKIFSVEKKSHSSPKEFYLKLFFTMLKLKWMAVTVCLYILAFLQQFSVCRKIFQLFFRSTKGLKFSISVPLNNNASSLFNTSISPEELINLNLQKSEGKILKWAISLNTGSKVVANLSFVFKPKNCFYSGWWLSEAKIMPQYWGSEIEEKILQRADELLGTLGASSIFTIFLKKDYFSRMFFRRRGFKESFAYKNPLSVCDHDSLNTGIILERKIEVRPAI